MFSTTAEKHRICEEVRTVSFLEIFITKAGICFRLIPKESLLKYKNVKDKDGFVADLSGKTKTAHAHYQIKLSTSPGRFVNQSKGLFHINLIRGVYEVTVLFDFLTRHLTLDLSSVSHVSRYGDDPHCIIDRNYFLATYCVCYDKI